MEKHILIKMHVCRLVLYFDYESIRENYNSNMYVNEQDIMKGRISQNIKTI